MIDHEQIDNWDGDGDLLEKHHHTMMKTQDPDNQLHGGPIPALTTLLIKVCDNNADKFNEALRLVGLFVEQKERDMSNGK